MKFHQYFLPAPAIVIPVIFPCKVHIAREGISRYIHYLLKGLLEIGQQAFIYSDRHNFEENLELYSQISGIPKEDCPVFSSKDTLKLFNRRARAEGRREFCIYEDQLTSPVLSTDFSYQSDLDLFIAAIPLTSLRLTGDLSCFLSIELHQNIVPDCFYVSVGADTQNSHARTMYSNANIEARVPFPSAAPSSCEFKVKVSDFIHDDFDKSLFVFVYSSIPIDICSASIRVFIAIANLRELPSQRWLKSLFLSNPVLEEIASLSLAMRTDDTLLIPNFSHSITLHSMSRKRIVMIHDLMVHEFARDFARYGDNVPLMLSAGTSFLASISRRDVVVTSSRHTKEQHLLKYASKFLDANRIAIVRPGVYKPEALACVPEDINYRNQKASLRSSLESDIRQILGIEAHRKLFLLFYPSRLRPNKNFEQVLASLELLNSSNTGIDYVSIFTDSWAERPNPLSAEFPEIIRSHVYFTGSLSEAQLYQFYSLVDITLSLSKFEGGAIPWPCLESILCSTPSILLETDMCKEVLCLAEYQPNDRLYFCEPGSASSLAKTIKTVLCKPKEAVEQLRRDLNALLNRTERDVAEDFISIVNSKMLKDADV